MQKKKLTEFVGVRIKADQRLRIHELAELHELPESIVIRKALTAGLKQFDESQREQRVVVQ
jgi:hypothetical protein